MKNIIITGSSRGIGFESVRLLAQQGHQLLALSRTLNPKLLSITNVTNLEVDLTKESDLDKVAVWLQSNWKNVDILIHNAGALILKPFKDLQKSDFEYIYNVNVFAVASLTQIVLPFMQSGSHVVTISSMGGIQGSMKFAGLAAYSSSKGAIITMSELLAEEYREKGITFNVLALGAVQTEMLEEAFPGYQANISALGMANYIVDFSLTGNKYYNGKVLQVSSSTP